MSQKVEKHEFQSEARQVLELMINSVYSNPDIFLRELISNASDALDKLRIESLSNTDLADLAKDGRITIEIDKDSKTLSISDNGIGMSEDFQKHIADMDGSVASARDKIDEIGQQIQTKQLIKKQCSAYRAFREIVENEKNT